MSNAANIEKIFAGPAGWAVVGLVAYLIYRAVSADVKKLASAGADVVGGTLSGNNAITQGARDWNGNPVDAYQGHGVLGTLGAGANAVSGGAFSSIGDWIGGKIADLTQSYDPNAVPPDRATPQKTTTVSSPVAPQTYVLPYSYKQQTVDAPSAYATDEIFTPSYEGGSSGGYLDYSGGPTLQ